MTKRRRFTDQFKARVALDALRGDRTIQEIAAKHQVHPNQVSTWKRQATEGLADVFATGLRTLNLKSYTPRSGGWRWRMIF